MMDESQESDRIPLSDYLAKTQAKFSQKLDNNISTKRRVVDFRRTFETTVHTTYPTLPVIWLQKHASLIRILLNNYSTNALKQMMTAYVARRQYHEEKGLKFDNFYALKETIAIDLERKETKAEAVAYRKQVSEPVQPIDSELEKFKESAFFKKMPGLFKNKLQESETTTHDFPAHSKEGQDA